MSGLDIEKSCVLSCNGFYRSIINDQRHQPHKKGGIYMEEATKAVSTATKLWDSMSDTLIDAGKSIIFALIVFIIGRIVISWLLKLFKKADFVKKIDPTVSSFLLSFIKICLYVLLIISVVSILGVPMTSIIALFTTASVAIGLALQGALSNLCGGLMLLLFRPFSVGDYIVSGDKEGVVKSISMVYTVLTTVDNKRVMLPNGALMASNIVNCSSEPTRRVDLDFSCAKGQDITKVKQLLLDVMDKNDKVLKDPKPFAELSGGTNESMTFTIRAWTKSESYWDVYFELITAATETLGANGVEAPSMRIKNI